MLFAKITYQVRKQTNTFAMNKIDLKVYVFTIITETNA
jgi:hypothetical protein